ncbi:MAG: DUF3536 domain-containing protein [Chloroflexi bacterium]|nr:DUF3536 domain-containing protein [Chloroflexota bacterium]
MTHFCVHCHFYQPPRGDPFVVDGLGPEPGAQPYQNFSEKAAATCYRPNAELGNFELMSFNIGATLLRWMQHESPDTFAAIIAADRAHRERWGVGNAIAVPQHHTILPLARQRDKITQIAWGLASFAHRFGRPAEGVWLPEMAVDLETLDILASRGVQFTILGGEQVIGADRGGGPYWVKLTAGRQIAVFVRDDFLSNQIAFELPALGGAGRWARGTLGPHKKTGGRLTLIATEGETFGHYHRGEEHFLRWLLSYEAHAVGYEVTTLVRDLRDHPPEAQVEIKEFTSWNCPHGQLRRWATGCDCTSGDSRWKGALRRALDNLASGVDEVFLSEAAPLGVEPWTLRDDYARVVVGEVADGQSLLREYGFGHLSEPQTGRIVTLLEAGFFRQRMYNSYAFFHEDLNQPEPRFAIANGVKAAMLVERAAGQGLIPSFRRDLAMAAASDGRSGADILDEILAENRA